MDNKTRWSDKPAVVPAVVPEVSVRIITLDDLHRVGSALKGSPAVFPDEDMPVLRALQDVGTAADFGEDGWACGWNWHQVHK